MSGTDETKNQNPSGTGEENKDQNTNPGGEGGGNSNSGDEIASLEDAKKVIEKLRKENAAQRKKHQSQEDSMKSLNEQLGSIKKHLKIEDEVDPAAKLKELEQEREGYELELSLSQLAREHSIPLEQDEYFRFLFGKKLNELKDGDELSEDAIKEIVGEVKKYAGFSKEKPNGNSSGVNEGGQKPNNGSGDEMTAEKFAKLGLGEKMKIFNEDKAKYDRLFQAAKEKRLI